METRRIVQRLRVEGLSIEAAALKWVQAWLERQPDPAFAFEQAILQLPKASLASNVLNVDVLNTAISNLSNVKVEDLKKHSLIVIPTTAFPHHRYNFARNGFIPHDDGAKPVLHGDAKDKIAMFRYRLALVRQRMLRRDTFSTPVLRSAAAEDHLQLTPIDSLLGSAGVRNVLGMLTQLEEGRWFLEDEKGNIAVDLSRATRTAGLFTEGVIVVARGRLEDERFVVEVLGHPLPERRAESLQAFPSIDFFGAAPPPKLLPRLQAMERDQGDMIVILSDVWLDRPEVMRALRQLFKGFDEAPPRAFVFIGNFSSRGVGHASEDSLSFRVHWEQLAELILQHKGISHSTDGSEFIFVPGPGDPSGAMLPRPPIPQCFTKALRERLPNQVTFATNPCRIRYCTQELVIFREDMMARMLRHCIVRPTQDTSLSHHLVKTLVDQGHLCPLPLTVRPIHWQLDYTLHLWPLPDMLILADQYEASETEYAGCQCRTVSSFATDFTFLTYIPGTREAQWSQIPDAEPAPEPPAAAEAPKPKKARAAKEAGDATAEKRKPAAKRRTKAAAPVQQQLAVQAKPKAKPAPPADDRPNGKAAPADADAEMAEAGAANGKGGDPEGADEDAAAESGEEDDNQASETLE